MLSFKELSEKKTKVIINPKMDQLKEKKGCSKCEDTCSENCKCSCHDKEMNKSAVPGKPAEKLKTDRNMFSIPKDEQDAAKERILAKTKAKREKMKMKEETEDSLRDKRMERGGVDGNVRYDKAPKFTSGPKKKYDGMSALDMVKADIRKKHGKGAIIDTKKK